MCTAARSGVGDAGLRVFVVTEGAGLVGGTGAVPVVLEDDPLPHAASTRAPTRNNERRTPGRVRGRNV
jgi:hypothetical protein